MKTASAFVTMLALAVVSGCQSAGPRGGGVSRDEGFNTNPSLRMPIRPIGHDTRIGRGCGPG